MTDFDILTYASLNVTFGGTNGDASPILIDTPDDVILSIVQEAIRAGSIPGIAQDPHVTLDDFRVHRFAPADGVLHHRIHVRPKAAFG